MNEPRDLTPRDGEHDSPIDRDDAHLEALLGADAITPLERRLLRERVLAVIRAGRRRRTMFRLSILPAAAAGLLIGIALARLILPPLAPVVQPDPSAAPVAAHQPTSDRPYRVEAEPRFTRQRAEITPVVLQGAVLDPHGMPLAGARISSAWETGAGSVVADPTGQFLLRVPPSASTSSVFHVAAPPGSAYRGVIYLHEPGRRVELALPAGTPLRGRVTDAATGQPLDQVRVELSVLWRGRLVHRELTSGDLDGFRLPPAPAVYDEAGRAEPRDLLLQLAIHRRGYVPQVAQFQSADALETALARPLALLPGARIAAHVITPAGRPLPGARVQLIPLERTDAPFTFDAPGGPCTDENGLVVFEGVTPGRVRVLVHHPDALAPAVTEMTAEAGRATTLEFPLQPARKLGGVVIDPEGRPLAGARVFAALESGADGGSALAHGPLVTGLDGKFAFSGLTPGRYVVRAFRSPMVGREDAARTLDGVATGREDLEVVMAASSLDLHIRVRDARDDRPISDCAVTLIGPGGTAVRAPDAIRDGVLILRGVDPSRTAVQVRAAGYLPSALQRIHAPGDGGSITLGVRLQPPAVLSGVLEDAVGRPLRGVMLVAGHEEVEPIRPDGRGYHTARKPSIALTDEHGRFTLTGLHARDGADLGVALAVIRRGRPPLTLPAIALLPGETREGVRLVVVR